MKKHEEFLTSIFQGNEFLLGQEINQAVKEYFSITRDAAKKIVQRAVIKGIINSSAPLSFGKGQYAYLPSQSKLTKAVFYKITKINRPSLYRLMNQVDINGGAISYYDALRISGVPIDKGTTKVKTLNELIKELELLDYVVKVRGHKELDYIVDKEKVDNINVLTQEQYSNMIMDCSLIPDIIHFLKGQNIIDNKNVIFRNKKKPNIGASHNGILWDVFAYTKTTGINTVLMSNSKSDDKSTLVVLDVMLSSTYSMNHFQGFIDRVQIMLNSTNQGIRKVLPILVFSVITSEALAKAKSLGYITLNISSIFGERVRGILSDLKLLRESDLINSNQSEFIDKIDMVMQSVIDTGQEINLSNIIGDLFESLILHLLKDIYHSASITPNKFLTNTLGVSAAREFEYDFIIDVGFEETIVVEAKGFNHNNVIPYGEHDKKNTIKWFFNHTFLSAKNNLEKRSSHPIKACFITTAKFSDETTAKLEALNKGKLKPSKMDLFYDGTKLLRLLDEIGNQDLKRVIKKHYFK